MRDHTSAFVQLLREYLTAYEEIDSLFGGSSPHSMTFDSIRDLVGEGNRSVLYRLKEQSHRLFRREEGHESQAVRREVLFDLAIGSLFHETMTLREVLYQREVYAPRLASLKTTSVDESEELFVEFERILEKGESRLIEVVAEIRILLAQTRDQLRRILIERAGERMVTRFLLRRREMVSRIFPEGFDGLIEAMHGNLTTGLIEAGRSLLESAYFVEGKATLEEAARAEAAPRSEIRGLILYAEGMQAFLDGDYGCSLTALEEWAESGGGAQDKDFARLASTMLSRFERLVSMDEGGESFATRAKQLQLRLDTAPG